MTNFWNVTTLNTDWYINYSYWTRNKKNFDQISCSKTKLFDNQGSTILWYYYDDNNWCDQKKIENIQIIINKVNKAQGYNDRILCTLLNSIKIR